MILKKVYGFIPQLPSSDCSLLPHNHYWIASKRIVTPNGTISGAGLLNQVLNFSDFREIDREFYTCRL